METVKVIVINNTESAKVPAELYLGSGLIKYDGSWSHIVAEKALGKTIIDVPEIKLSIVPGSLETPTVMPRSAGRPSKKSKG